MPESLPVRETVARFVEEFASEHSLKYLHIEYDGGDPSNPKEDVAEAWRLVKPEEYAKRRRGEKAMWVLHFPEDAPGTPLSDAILVFLCEKTNTLQLLAGDLRYKFQAKPESVAEMKEPLERILRLMHMPPLDACPIEYFSKYDLKSCEEYGLRNIEDCGISIVTAMPCGTPPPV